jgi:CheY-like chemotaxis protein
MRTLYVDDDRINTLLFVEACRFADGIEVETALNGAEALELAERWQPELLVVDLHLPDTTGYLLLAALRQLLRQPALPAYLCTAEDTARVTGPAAAAGFDGVWSKPVELTQMLAELSRRRGPAAAPA